MNYKIVTEASVDMPREFAEENDIKRKGTTMLKGISPVISPDLLKVLAEMG